MKISKLISLIFGIVILLQSCNVLYIPNMQNVPLLKEKNEVRASIGISDFQGAYAITNNIGVIINGQSNLKSTSSYVDKEYVLVEDHDCQNKVLELGIGYLNQISDSKVLEVYGGVGFGKNSIKNSFKVDSTGIFYKKESFSANTFRFFVQPNIGITTDIVDIAFSTRFVFLKFSNIDTLGFTTDRLLEKNLYGVDKQNYMFLEPAVTLRFGYKYVKFHAQVASSFCINNQLINYLPINIILGVHINIGRRFYSNSNRNKKSLD
jgi:hypothetical protein